MRRWRILPLALVLLAYLALQVYALSLHRWELAERGVLQQVVSRDVLRCPKPLTAWVLAAPGFIGVQPAGGRMASYRATGRAIQPASIAVHLRARVGPYRLYTGPGDLRAVYLKVPWYPAYLEYKPGAC